MTKELVVSARMWSVRFALFDRYADTPITRERGKNESTRVVTLSSRFSLLATRQHSFLSTFLHHTTLCLVYRIYLFILMMVPSLRYQSLFCLPGGLLTWSRRAYWPTRFRRSRKLDRADRCLATIALASLEAHHAQVAVPTICLK